MDSIVLGLQLVLAAVFVVAGVGKLMDMAGTRRAVAGFGVPRRAAPVVAPLLPLAELTVAVALIPASSARWGAVGAAALLLAFAAGIANAMAQGRTPDCHCFGNLHSAPAGGRTLARNLGLAALAGVVAVQGPDTEIGDWVAARTAAELVAVGCALAALALGALALRMRSENRRLRHVLLHAQAAPAPQPEPEPEGLAVGTPAPAFELEGLGGERRSLESLRAGGRPVLLVFLDPGCGPCHGLVDHVARWQASLAARMAVAVISEGAPDRVRSAWRGHHTQVLLDSDSQVTRGAYHVLTWPSALAIGPDGRIAHELVYSQDAMEVLIRQLLAMPPHRAEPSPPTAATASTPA